MTDYSHLLGNVAGVLQGFGIANAFGAKNLLQLFMGIGFIVIGTIIYLIPIGDR